VDRSRLEAFSDGVFAVAITLLALNLTVAGPGRISLQHQLWEHRWSFVAYLISFFTIGIIWVNHHALIRSVKTVDRTLLFVNLVLLLFVVLIPFSTATAAEYLASTQAGNARVAMALYAAVFLGMSVGFGSIFEWTLHGERVYQPVPPERHWAARFRFAGGAGVYVIALVIALFNAYAAFTLMGLVAVYYVFERTPAPAGSGNGSDGDEPAAPGSREDDTSIA
jgi:uncharacterized membrane protein